MQGWRKLYTFRLTLHPYKDTNIHLHIFLPDFIGLFLQAEASVPQLVGWQ